GSAVAMVLFSRPGAGLGKNRIRILHRSKCLPTHQPYRRRPRAPSVSPKPPRRRTRGRRTVYADATSRGRTTPSAEMGPPDHAVRHDWPRAVAPDRLHDLASLGWRNDRELSRAGRPSATRPV